MVTATYFCMKITSSTVVTFQWLEVGGRHCESTAQDQGPGTRDLGSACWMDLPWRSHHSHPMLLASFPFSEKGGGSHEMTPPPRFKSSFVPLEWFLVSRGPQNCIALNRMPRHSRLIPMCLGPLASVYLHAGHGTVLSGGHRCTRHFLLWVLPMVLQEDRDGERW